MIPQNLIELIHKGVAQYKTFAMGGTGSALLQVPKNNYIVILSFTYHHFVEYQKEDEDKIIAAYKNAIHCVNFKSQKNEYYYAIRSNFQVLKPEVTFGNAFLSINTNDTTYNCYQVHKNNCHVDIWRINDFNKWIATPAYMQDKTNEPPTPAGYGTLSSLPNSELVNDNIIFDGVGLNDQYLPYGNESGIIAALPNYFNQFRNGINADTKLLPLIKNEDTLFTFPLVNIGYVLVNEPFDKNIK